MRVTVREQILQRLRAGSVTLRELAGALGLRERETADHLAHARRSLPAAEELAEAPATCLGCGFVFRKRDRLTTPGRCPRCRNERIQPARFRVRCRE